MMGAFESPLGSRDASRLPFLAISSFVWFLLFSRVSLLCSARGINATIGFLAVFWLPTEVRHRLPILMAVSSFHWQLLCFFIQAIGNKRPVFLASRLTLCWFLCCSDFLFLKVCFAFERKGDSLLIQGAFPCALELLASSRAEMLRPGNRLYLNHLAHAWLLECSQQRNSMFSCVRAYFH